MGALTGLLAGINQTADENRQRVRDQELQQERFERAELARIAGDENYTQDIRERAATSLMEIASNPTKRPKGSFTDRLLGVNRIEAHPSITNLMRFMQTPEMKGQLPTGLRQTSTAPNPSAAGAVPPPTSAAMPPTPAGQAGGGPPSVSALGSPGGGTSPVGGMGIVGPTPTQGGEIGGMPVGPRATGAIPGVDFSGVPGQAAQPPPQVDDGLPDGPLPGVNEATGAGPQGQTAGMPVPRRIMRTPAEIAIEHAKAKAQGDVEGEIEGYVAAGMPREQALEMVRLSKIRQARGGSANVYRPVDLEVPDPSAPGRWIPIKGNFSAATGDYEDMAGNVLTHARPRMTSASVSAGSAKEAAASRLFGQRYMTLNPQQAAQADQLALTLSAQEVSGDTSARMTAEATGPLSVSARTNAEAAMRDDLTRLETDYQTMVSQYQVMNTALNRFGTDPVGSVEGIRVTFAKILDPTSVVREAEYARQGFGLSAFDKLRGMYQRYVEGGGDIPEPILREMTETARQFVVGARERNVKLRQRFTDIATRQGLNPANVTGVANTPPPDISAPPGTINAPAPPQGQTTPAPATAPPPPTVPADATPPPATAPAMNMSPSGAAVYQGPTPRVTADGRTLGQVNGKAVVLQPDGAGSFVVAATPAAPAAPTTAAPLPSAATISSGPAPSTAPSGLSRYLPRPTAPAAATPPPAVEAPPPSTAAAAGGLTFANGSFTLDGRPVPPRSAIHHEAQVVGLDPNLAIEVARKESSLNPSTRPGDGGAAIGLFQMHDAAAEDAGISDRNDPVQNVRGGVRYLKQLVDRYGGDVRKALQAYNGGSRNVDNGTVSAAAKAYADSILTTLGTLARR